MWYTPIGWFVTTLVAIVVSWATTFNVPKQMNMLLFSPGTSWLLDSLPAKWQDKLNWSKNSQDEDANKSPGVEMKEN